MTIAQISSPPGRYRENPRENTDVNGKGAEGNRITWSSRMGNSKSSDHPLNVASVHGIRLDMNPLDDADFMVYTEGPFTAAYLARGDGIHGVLPLQR
jgi:hypothetical protein